MEEIQVETGFSISYKRSSIDESSLETIRYTTYRFGELNEEPYDNRLGAIDLASVLTFSIGSLSVFILSQFVQIPAQEFISGFWKGLLGEDFFEKSGNDLGQVIREQAPRIAKIQKIKTDYYLYELFRFLLSGKLDSLSAYAIEESFEVDGKSITMFIVLNHHGMSTDLILDVSSSVEKAISYLQKYGLPSDESPGLVQLYPDFLENTWRYLFVPSNQNFGRFIDSVIDLKTEEVMYINSANEFIELFNIRKADRNKFIVSPRDENRRFLLGE